MAGYGWSLRHGTNHEQPQRHTHIACRICDRVFMNAQALIDHIESHIAEDHISTDSPRNRSLTPCQPLQGSLPNPFELSLSPPVSTQKPPYSFKSFQNPKSFNFGLYPPSIAKRPTNIVNQPFSLMGRKFFATKESQRPYVPEAQDYGMMETRNEDHTRPFLQKLDKPISYISEFKKMGDDNSHNSADLDLSLKL